MSKFRRQNVGSPSRKVSKSLNDTADENADHQLGAKLKLNRGKLISHDAFLNRIQKSLYYGDSKSKMSIPLSDYIADSFSNTHTGYSLNRLNYATVGNLRATPCSLILAIIYLERMKDADPAYTKHVTPTELFLVSMMVATKFSSGHDDEAPHVNWAECMNVSSDALFDMELAFLNAIDWKVYVSNEEFFDKIGSLERTLARRQGTHRGWFTYMEMGNLLPSIQIATDFIQTTLVFGLSYTFFVATMVASVFLVSRIPGTYLHTAQHARTTSTSTSATSTTPSVDLDSTSQALANDTGLMPTNMHNNTALDSMAVIENDSNIADILNRLNEVPDLQTSENQSNKRHDPYTFESWPSAILQNALNWSVISDSLQRQRLIVDSCESDLDEFSPSSFCNLTLSTNIYPLQSFNNRIKIDFNGVKLRFV